MSEMQEHTENTLEYGVQPQKTWEHIFDTPGNKKILINNNLKTIVSVIKDKTKIVDITLGSGVSAIEDNCFKGFTNLTSVNGGENCQRIGEHAFENCSSLVNCDMVDNGKTTITYIGKRAFGNTKLNRVFIDLYGTSYAGGIEDGAFSDCSSLTSVTFQRSSMIPQNGFKGCTNLKSVTLPNSTSFVYDGCFKNCKSIEKFVFPSKIWGIGAEMFMGCENLKEIEIQDTDDSPSIMRTFGANAFSGCPKLKTLVLPKSLKNINQIDPAFLSGSSVEKIYLKGFDDDILKNAQQTVTNIPTNKYGFITTRDNMVNAYNDAIERGIPIIVITQYYPYPQRDDDCKFCKRLSNLLDSTQWKNFMKKYKDVCYFFFVSYTEDLDLWEEISIGNGTVFPKFFSGKYTYQGESKNSKVVINDWFAKIMLFWKRTKNGNDEMYNILMEDEENYNYVNGKKISQTRVEYLESLVKTATEEINNRQSKTVSSMSKFGSPRKSITVVSKTKKFYEISSDSQTSEFIPPEPDNETEDGFLPGIWYGKARKLKEYVDENNLPCFVEFSDAGCTPCKEFKSTIYNNPDFQNWVKDSGYYYCRIETESHSQFDRVGTDPYFVLHEWAKNTETIIPIFVYYWNKSDGTEVWNISSFHDSQMSMEQLIDSISSNFQ